MAILELEDNPPLLDSSVVPEVEQRFRAKDDKSRVEERGQQNLARHSKLSVSTPVSCFGVHCCQVVRFEGPQHVSLQNFVAN